MTLPVIQAIHASELIPSIEPVKWLWALLSRGALIVEDSTRYRGPRPIVASLEEPLVNQMGGLVNRVIWSDEEITLEKWRWGIFHGCLRWLVIPTSLHTAYEAYKGRHNWDVVHAMRDCYKGFFEEPCGERMWVYDVFEDTGMVPDPEVPGAFIGFLADPPVYQVDPKTDLSSILRGRFTIIPVDEA